MSVWHKPQYKTSHSTMVSLMGGSVISFNFTDHGLRNQCSIVKRHDDSGKAFFPESMICWKNSWFQYFLKRNTNTSISATLPFRFFIHQRFGGRTLVGVSESFFHRINEPFYSVEVVTRFLFIYKCWFLQFREGQETWTRSALYPVKRTRPFWREIITRLF